MKKLNRNETILISLLSLSLFYAYDRFWATPQKAQQVAIKKAVAKVQAESLEDSKQLEKLLKSRTPAAQGPDNTKALLDRYLKSNDRLSRIVSELAAESSEPFNLSRIATESSTKVDAYTKTLISLEAEANFVSIGKFLEKLEDSPLLTEVESIEISRVKDDLKLCDAKIRLYSYVAGPEK